MPLKPDYPAGVMEEVMELMLKYARQNMTYKEISLLLAKETNLQLGPDAIRKRLRRTGTQSRKGNTAHTVIEVKNIIQALLPDLPSTIGYRQMTCILRQKQVNIPRDTVMKIMRELDPIGVDIRRRRRINRRIYRTMGPNHVWHVDGYDKLKPYGFPIHGCIDGFSRKILWLKVGPTNNDPEVIAFNFAQCVDELKGCPMVLQADPGTESGIMGSLQCLFRHTSNASFSGIRSYRVVRSIFNQRIEAWWSVMRRQQCEWWISFFKDLVEFGGLHKGTINEMHCIRYCFMPLLQMDLDHLMDRWNNHYISHSRQAACPGGRPAVLYRLPEASGFQECLQALQEEDIAFAYAKTRLASRSGCPQFDIRAHAIFQQKGWDNARSWQEALQQYFIIVEMNL
ncbi:uncharacterized protein LOC117332637 isoform X2 [Pecten maximus]|uniref:uncharacterized protein LOC117332637 isoform X2 n=1 Tax=Pecten maximus TaxID=6579 RepID=UPI001457FEAC|nr:uncharacterized protein LOC117332637 isoform X2 [Pecten maximus]